MIFLAELPAPSRMGDILMAFLSIVFEGAPYILIGTVFSGIIDAFLPAKLLDRVLPKSKVLATLIAGFLGLVFPVCECAVVPVIRRLVQKGLPLSCAVTYMLSAPIMNPIVAISTLTAFKEFQGLTWATAGNATMTIARLSLGYLVAVIVGLIVMRFKPGQVLRASIAAKIEKAATTEDDHVHAPASSFNGKLVHAMRSSMRDFLDTAMYFAIGVAITSVFNTQINQGLLNTVAGNDWLAVPSLMGLAVVLSLCSTSDAFIAAPMTAFSMAAKLAFLVFGPMMDIKLLFMYSSVFKRKVVVSLLIGLFILVGLLSGPWMNLVQHLYIKP
ncbi:MAG: permease [Prosthecobacter sp.]|uniref:permease n=1 Tax=Prosthecobacter sp. TaxID=1965333 RepID=UPI0025F54CE6|nr:permease [Prosthecobacter sp.]MCF7788228.1 permease [Prosthecobacter sp.]